MTEHADSPVTHQIGEVAELVGLSLRTIRHYEEVALVSPSARTSGGFRLYDEADIERLRLVRRMKPLDFTLVEMRELLEVRDRLASDRTASGERAELLERLAMFAAAAEQRCERLREQLTEAEAVAMVLRDEAASSAQSAKRPARNSR